MAELSIHFERTETAVADTVRASKLGWVLLVNPPAGSSPFPNQKVLGRFTDDDEGRLLGMGANGADEWWFRHEAQVRAASYLYAITMCNEPGNGNEANVSAYIIRWCALSRAKVPNMKIYGPNFSNGCPEPQDAGRYANALRCLDYLSFHEYFMPQHWVNATAWVGWLVGRYKKFMANLPADLQSKQILITEYGCDALSLTTLGLTPLEEGWKVHYPSREAYMIDLKKGKAVYDPDPRVLCVLVYEAGPWPRWVSYEVDVPLANDIIATNTSTAAPVPPPVVVPPAPQPPTLDARLLALEAKLTAVQATLSNLTTVDAFGYHLVYRKD
jgi:hypothetical protein